MVLLIPFNTIVMSKMRGLIVKMMTIKDDRLKQINEVLNGIKVILKKISIIFIFLFQIREQANIIPLRKSR